MGHFRSCFFRTFFILIAAMGLLALDAQAQRGTALLTGTVKDASGAVIPGAKVTLTNTGTNVSHSVTTNATGDYLFPEVQIGGYRLTVEKQGFRKYVQSGIQLSINQNARMDVPLQVGSTSQVVEVTENVPQVDTVTATLGDVESQTRIEQLPLVERDTLQLGLLQAGVLKPPSDDGSGNPFSVSGQRSESLTFLIDGADNTDFLSNNIVVSPNPDAVQEFKILTLNYTAEYGRTSGGIVNQVIRSGSNQLHGSAFEFLRNDIFNARDYFLPARTSFKRNVFGGTFGGAIKKDKTFFFLAYQGSRRREGEAPPILQVLSPAERTGNFAEICPSGFTGGICNDPANQLTNPITGNPYPNNQVQVNPVIANYINKYLPMPNLPGNQFISSPVIQVRDDQGIMRIDHHISDYDTLSAVWLIDDLGDFYPFQIINGASTGGNVPNGSAFSDFTRYQTGSVTWTHLFTPTLFNEARMAFNRRAGLQAVPQDTTPPSALGFTNLNPDDPAGAAPPIIFTNSFNLGPSPQGPTKEHDVTFQWQDTVSWTHGKHDFKFGTDIRRVRNNFHYDFFNNGSYDFTFGNFTGNELADFVGGFPDNFFQFSRAVYGIRTSSFHFFGQDSWKVTPRLTLDLGLRYEYNTPQTDPHNEIIGWFPGHQSTVFPSAPPDVLYPGDPGTPNRALVYPDKNNFAPRFGFAWDMLGNAKLVMRGGFGIFYDIEDGAFNLQFGGQPPFGDAANLYYGPFPSGIDPVADPYNGFFPGTPNPFPFRQVGTFFVPKISFAYVVDPHFVTPYSENFNWGFQYQLAKNTMLETTYVGSLGRKLIGTNEVNYPQPAILAQQLASNGFFNSDCARALAGCDSPLDPNGSPTGATLLLTDSNSSLSDSHQLQVTLDQRLSRGLTFRTAYTWSKTIDMLSGFRSRSSAFTDPLNYRFDRGLADFDSPHRLVVSWVYALPFGHLAQGNSVLHHIADGWQVNGIASFQSGNPFTLFQNNNSSGQENFLDRPDVLGPVTVFNNPRQVRSFGPGADGSHGSCLAGPATGNFWFDPTNFDCATVPLLSFGNMSRNSLRGPGINNWDLSIVRNFQVKEKQTLQFRSEFFNAFNHTQFLNPDLQGFSGTFGEVTTARSPRLIQFALKYSF